MLHHVSGASRQPGTLGARFEILPLGRGEQEAAQLPGPTRLTVTCSPRHGPDRTVEVGARLAALGHIVTVHVAARMVRDEEHLDRLLADIAQAGIDDLFLIGGDTPEPTGRYSSAVELLPVICGHARRPRTIGIAAYPEGHPLIDPPTLAGALAQKSELADYLTTQLCFDGRTVLSWVEDARRHGLTLPVLVGMPGAIDPRKLLEISMRIGVGPSLRFMRKQRGLRNLLGGQSAAAADRLYDALAPRVGKPDLNITGFHYFTFNQLLATWNWEREKRYHGELVAES